MQSIRTMLNSGARQFYADAEQWRLTRRGALAIALFPLIVGGIIILIVALSLLMRYPFRPLFRWVTEEDSLLEWLQFACIFSASVIFARIGAQLVRVGQRGAGLFYLLIALGAFFVVGEEISWGQRIFGWGTPETLDAINHQGETNVHNIRFVQRAFGLVILVGSMYCSFAPPLKLKFWNERSRSALSFLLIPPLCLIPAFLMPFGYKMFRLLVWPGTNYTVVKFGEVPELCLYFGLMMFAWLNLRQLRVEERASVANAVPTT
jgi:hypothetical protein